jgi:hypothetical protein
MSLLPSPLSRDVESIIVGFFDPRQFYALLADAYLSRLLRQIPGSENIVVKFVGVRNFLLGNITGEEKVYWRSRKQPKLKNAYTKENLNMARYIVLKRKPKIGDWLFLKSKKTPTGIQKGIIDVMLNRTSYLYLPKIHAMALKSRNQYLEKTVAKRIRQIKNENEERLKRHKKSRRSEKHKKL